MENYELINTCPITGKQDKSIYLDLGMMPLVNNLNDTKKESLVCEKYPLEVQLFEDSRLSSLTVAVDPNILYKNYLYKSGVSKPYIDHCKEMLWFLDSYLFLKEGDRILDIGGNDGTLLRTFLDKNPKLEVLNIDASENLTNEAIGNGIPSINAFWGEEVSKKIDIKFRAIITTNCFQHTRPIESFVKGIKNSLDRFGIWCLEFPYWKDSVETNQFDQVYHEHVYYYTIGTLKRLFNANGLEIIKAVRYKIHGGTMRLLITHKGLLNETFQPCSSVDKIIEEEAKSLEEYIVWGKQINSNLEESKDFLISLKKSGNRIAGFGAAAKGCIFLNASNIDHQILDFIIDDTNLKQGKFVPGTGLEVVSRDILKKEKIDYIVILAHNFKDYIIESLKDFGYTGKFITFLPEFKII
jgi:hypothetical protein